jgi:CrcB protein
MLVTLSHVALGGALGAVLRYLAGAWALRAFGPGFPWGTLFVNVAGSLLIGALAVALADKGARSAPFLIAGVLGGFTTFSAFSLETLALIEAGRAPLAALYVAASVLLSLLAVAAGALLSRAILA